MNRMLQLFVLSALLCVLPLAGQLVKVDSLGFQTTAPPAVTGLGGSAQGTLGSVTLYYWVAARYPAGVVVSQTPARVVKTQGIAGLTGVNFVSLQWAAAPGAGSYDVIRQTTGQWVGACTACVVSVNQVGTTFNDIGGATGNWPTPKPAVVIASNANVTLSINNRDDNYPFLAVNGELHFMPVRSTLPYSYMFEIGGVMTGGAVQKTYALGINVTRPPTAIATGDSNDALIRGSYSNYAANDANFIVRGVNTLVTNRSGGTLGMLDNLISVANRSGGTAPIVNGLTVNAENFGTNATQHSALDLSIKNEGAKATLEFGIRIRNLNNSLGTAADAAILIPTDALANLGWTHGIDFNGAKVVYDFRTHAGPQLFSGAGAPAAGDCAAGTLGSIYLNNAGGANTSLYVCQTAGGWTAVTP
jgi:hypothetical protein